MWGGGVGREEGMGVMGGWGGVCPDPFGCPPPDVARAVELLERLQRSGEMPPQKLQALQRVLQSKFCCAIREVTPPEPPRNPHRPPQNPYSPP